MRRLLLGLSLAVLTALPLAVNSNAASVYVNPAAGSQSDSFTFSGAGFPPGTRLDPTFTSPDGQQFELKTSKGKPAIWQVDATGIFSFDLLPAQDFAGGTAGTWTVSFCIEGTTDCWEGTFDIAL